MNMTSKAYLVGSGNGSLAAAAFMIGDGVLPGESLKMVAYDHLFIMISVIGCTVIIKAKNPLFGTTADRL